MSLHRRRLNKLKEAQAETREQQRPAKDIGFSSRAHYVPANSVLRNAVLRYLITVMLAATFWMVMQKVFRHSGHGLAPA